MKLLNNRQAFWLYTLYRLALTVLGVLLVAFGLIYGFIWVSSTHDVSGYTRFFVAAYCLGATIGGSALLMMIGLLPKPSEIRSQLARYQRYEAKNSRSHSKVL